MIQHAIDIHPAYASHENELCRAASVRGWAHDAGCVLECDLCHGLGMTNGGDGSLSGDEREEEQDVIC